MTTSWKIDPAHSEIQFKVKHLMITTITGNFGSYDLEIETEDEDFSKVSKIDFSTTVDSISTGSELRDGHLKSADFFDVENNPVITFKGESFEKKGEDRFILNGELMIKCVTRPIVAEVEFGGIAVDPYNQTKAGFSLTAKINRRDFALTWNGVTDSGNIVLGDEIRILCEIQLVKNN
jgi:polyisoprenoid-binding protein YceI